MEKQIIFTPAFDKHDPNPIKNYGIHGVDLKFLLGDKNIGFVQFVVFTNWHLPHVFEESRHKDDNFIIREDYPFDFWQAPIPADLGWHSAKPRYDDQPSIDCHLLASGICYYNGSGLNAIPMFDTLRTEGSEGVWKALESYYEELFSSPTL